MLNVIFIVGVIALRHLPTLLNVDVDVDVGLRDSESQELFCRGQHTSVSFEFQLKCTIIRYMGFTIVKTHISVTRK